MSIVSVRKTLQATLPGAQNVRMFYRGGGRLQVVSFQLDGADHELVIGGDKPLLAELASAAEILKANLNSEDEQ